MKRILTFLVLPALAGGLMLCSCSKEAEPSAKGNGAPQEISFRLGGEGLDFGVSTKASEVTSLSSVFWEAANSSKVVHSVKSYNVSSGVVSTGLYWPSAGETFSYKVANFAFTTSTGAFAATNTTDYVAGTATGVTSNSCTVALDHIFARTAALSLNPQSGYTITGTPVWKIESSGAGTGTAGTYTVGSGWGSTATTKLASTTFTSSSDLYLIPGAYKVTVTYTLTKGDYSEEFTKSGTVTLVQGKKNSITATAKGGDASEISFNVTLTPWGTQSLDLILND